MSVDGSYAITRRSNLTGQYKKTTITRTEFSHLRRFTASDASSSIYFGMTIAIRNKRAVVSAPGFDDPEAEGGFGSAGAIYHYKKGDTWDNRTESKLTSSIRQNVMKIGTFEASSNYSSKYNALSVYKETVVAGMPGWYDGSSDYPGGAIVWDKTLWGETENGVWREQFLTASDKAHFDYFGAGVATFGEYIAVGAPFEDTKSTSSGKVYIFQTASSAVGWNEKTQLVPEFGDGAYDENDARFGSCIYITGSKHINGVGANIRMAIGAYGKDKVVILKKNENDLFNWTQEAIISHPSGTTGVSFGGKVALNNNTLVIGAPSEDIGGTNNGSVSIFKSSSAGGWTFHQGINLGSNFAGKTGAQFGLSVDLEGEYLAVAAPFYSSSESGQGISQGGFDGRVFLYKSGSSAWSLHAQYQPYDHKSFVEPTIGTGLGLSDGCLIYGAYNAGSSNTGSVTIIESINQNTVVDVEPNLIMGSKGAFNIRGQTKDQNYRQTLS